MNDQDIARLLEQRVRNVDVTPPPIAAVMSHGRLRARVRRGAQIAGTACAVSAIAVAGLALHADTNSADRADVAHEGRVSQPTASLPGRTPTAAQLLGTWHRGGIPWVLQDRSARRFIDPWQLTFGLDRGELQWSGYDGCNWWSGTFHLHPDGHFDAGHGVATLIGCPAGTGYPGQRSSVWVLMKASYVRLDATMLRFYDDSGQLVATFIIAGYR